MRARPNLIPALLAASAAAAFTFAASAQARVWDSRDLWASSSTSSSSASDRLSQAMAQFADGSAYLAILLAAWGPCP